MPFSSKLPKKTTQLLAWYTVPATGYCHLVPMHLEKDADGGETLVAAPTATQQDLIVYPEDDAVNAGHFFCCHVGRIIHLN